MKTTITETDGKVIVAVQGELDTDSCEQFQTDIASVAEGSNQAVELDLGRMEYISSKALRVIISFQQRITGQGGSLKVTHVLPAVREVFDMTGLSKSFQVE